MKKLHCEPNLLRHPRESPLRDFLRFETFTNKGCQHTECVSCSRLLLRVSTLMLGASVVCARTLCLPVCCRSPLFSVCLLCFGASELCARCLCKATARTRDAPRRDHIFENFCWTGSSRSRDGPALNACLLCAFICSSLSLNWDATFFISSWYLEYAQSLSVFTYVVHPAFWRLTRWRVGKRRICRFGSEANERLCLETIIRLAPRGRDKTDVAFESN